VLVGRDQCLQFLRIKSGRERIRAGKIADEDRYLPALRRARRYRRSISTSLRDFAAAAPPEVVPCRWFHSRRISQRNAFGRCVRIDPQFLCEQIGAGAILAKRRAVSALSAIEFHESAMDTLLQGVGCEHPGRDANAASTAPVDK